MMVMSRQSPLRFVVFLVVVAALLTYVVVKWSAFTEQTVADPSLSGSPIVVIGDTDPDAAGGEVGDTVGDAGSPDGEAPAAGAESLPDAVPATVEVEAQPEAAYFAEVRLERERSRSQRIEVLQGLIDAPDVDAETRRSAEDELIELSRRMTRETDIEGLVKARGYEQVIVYLYEEAAVVIVRADALTEAAAAQIADAVVKVAEVPFGGISVMARPH